MNVVDFSGSRTCKSVTMVDVETVPVSDEIERSPEKLFDMDSLKDWVVYDRTGAHTLFDSLCTGKTTIIIFLRHFLDYVTRDYVEDFSKIFPHTLHEKNVRILLIGCAHPKHIGKFVEDTSCPHAVYCDPKRLLYQTMGLYPQPQDLLGSKSPHVKSNAFVGFWQTVWRAMVSMNEQGDTFQQGGQLVLDESGDILFFHRDRHSLDHTPINELLAVAGLPRIDFCTNTPNKIHHV